MSIQTAVYPSSWKVGQNVPIYKKRNRADDANYRPVTLLPLLSKAMERVVPEQLKGYLEQHYIIHSAQHGFHKKRSCCSALLALSNNLSTAKNDGLLSSIAALDFSRAFDAINHSILLKNFASIGYSANALTWFSS